jgi:hypothetical protein
VLTLVVVPGTGCSVAPTDPPWLLRPDAGKTVAEEFPPEALPVGDCAKALPTHMRTFKSITLPNFFMASLVI